MAITQITQRDSQLEAQRRGYLGLTLTEFNTTNEPEIELGSVIEIGGSLYTITGVDEAIGGAAVAGINYIYFLNDASGFEYSDEEPTWDASLNGYYNTSNDRAVAIFYYDNPDYLYKSIIDSIHMENIDRQVFTTTGTWNRPSWARDTDSLIILLIGGGGSGGVARWTGGGGGGAGGGFQIINEFVGTFGDSHAVTVGAGGIARSRSSDGHAAGNAGGNTEFLPYVALGGPGGSANSGFGPRTISAVWLDYTYGEENILDFTGNTGGYGHADFYYQENSWGVGAVINPLSLHMGPGGGGIGQREDTTGNSGAVSRLCGNGGNGHSSGNGSPGTFPGGGGGGAFRESGTVISGEGSQGMAIIYTFPRGIRPDLMHIPWITNLREFAP